MLSVGLPEADESWLTSKSFPNLSSMSQVYKAHPEEDLVKVLWGTEPLILIWAIREGFLEGIKFELYL